MIILKIISVIAFLVIIIATILSMIKDSKRDRVYHEYFARKKKERDEWMNEHGF